MLLHDGDVAEEESQQCEQRGPAQAAQHRERGEPAPAHAGNTGDERHERADEREEAAEEHGRSGVMAFPLPDAMIRRPKKCPMK